MLRALRRLVTLRLRSPGEPKDVSRSPRIGAIVRGLLTPFDSPRRKVVSVSAWPFLLFLLAFVVGCGGGGSGSVKSFQPTGVSAKAALTTALEEWKSGRKEPGLIETSKPAVQVQDSLWSSGRKLKGFQIGEEQISPDGPTRFKVQLTFDGDPPAEAAEYVVFGKDPLWVCHDIDYRKMTGMPAAQ